MFVQDIRIHYEPRKGWPCARDRDGPGSPDIRCVLGEHEDVKAANDILIAAELMSQLMMTLRAVASSRL